MLWDQGVPNPALRLACGPRLLSTRSLLWWLGKGQVGQQQQDISWQWAVVGCGDDCMSGVEGGGPGVSSTAQGIKMKAFGVEQTVPLMLMNIHSQ